MALILDKTHTGVTSVDISGNTLTTGYTNLDYTDQFGNVYNDSYLVIDNFIIDKLLKSVRVDITIYKDSTSRDEQKLPIHSGYISIPSGDGLYDTYFSIENMVDNNVFAAAYDFIQTEYYPSWKSDE